MKDNFNVSVLSKKNVIKYSDYLLIQQFKVDSKKIADLIMLGSEHFKSAI
jgi:hypothetical protein